MTEKSWLNKEEYPFESKFLELPDGRMHYVDEGAGEPIVMVHGTPVWSFVYRKLIKYLSANYRVIAMDHIGFGLSDKPADWAATPEAHAQNFSALIKHLNLKDMTLAVHDFGGSIGLSYAIENPDSVKRLILFNTWMWSLEGDKSIKMGSRLFGSFLGKLLYKGLNFSPKILIPKMMGDRSKLTPEIHQQYIKPFSSWGERHAPWTFARELVASSQWFDSLWSKRESIKNMPALILWGIKDPGLNENYLKHWDDVFSNAEIVKFPNSGHFVQEEAPEEAIAHIRRFLERT